MYEVAAVVYTGMGKEIECTLKLHLKFIYIMAADLVVPSHRKSRRI